MANRIPTHTSPFEVMAKTLLSISLLIIIVTAGFAVATKGRVEALHTDLRGTKSNLVSAKSNLAKTELTLKTAEENLVAAKATIEEKEKDIATHKAELARVAEEMKIAATAVASKTEELAVAKEKLTKFELEFEGVNPVELKAKMEELTTQVAKKTTELEELTAVMATLEQQKVAADDKLVTTQQIVKDYKDGIVRNGLSGKILAYNPGWNFVVLNLGDRQGLKANAHMLVIRGGEAIAKIKVTSVEPGTSIADIIPSSVARGVSVQPGDTVVFENKR